MKCPVTVEKPKNLPLRPQEVKLADELIGGLPKILTPLVEAKQKGKVALERAVTKQAKVIGIVDALKRSVQQAEQGSRRPKPGPTLS